MSKHPTPVPRDEAAALVAQLRREGWSVNEIKRQTGVSRTTLQRITQHRCAWITRGTYNQLLLLATPAPPDGALVSAVGTHRRLQALHWQGWSWRQIDAHRGVAEIGGSACSRILRQQTVTVRLQKEIAALTEQLWRQQPPAGKAATQARNRARARGWPPLAAWDDIDDPAEKPKHQLTKHQAQHQRRYARGQKRWRSA